LDKVEENQCNIFVLIGAAVSAAGNNIVATVLTTFAIDSSKHAPDVGLYLNFVRLIFGFTGPFYFALMFERLKYSGAAGLMVSFVGIFGVLNMFVVHILGLRRNK